MTMAREDRVCIHSIIHSFIHSFIHFTVNQLMTEAGEVVILNMEKREKADSAAEAAAKTAAGKEKEEF